MPVSSYSEYKNPETGETIWLPQLFPYASCTGTMSSTEIEDWVKTGIIPKDLYESAIECRQISEDHFRRLETGEEILASELPTKPWALTEYLLKNKARLYGENVLTKIFSALADNDPDIVWLSFIKDAISSLQSTDPLPIHFFSARKTLIDKYGIDDPRAVDLLARELLVSCRSISNFKALQHSAFNKNPIDLEDLNDHLKDQKKDMLEIDAEFISLLKGIGAKGKKLAAQVEKTSIELFKFYEDNNYSSLHRRKTWGLWVPENETISTVFFLLGQALWEDKCLKLWDREIKGSPSLVDPIVKKMITILSPSKRKKFVEKDGSIICYQEGNPLLIAPAVDANMISAFQKGVKELSTLTGHKMLRWEVQAGFERWSQGIKDPRLIEINGGYSKIAELIKCKSSHEIVKVKEILHAQAFGSFIFQDGSHGNMITLNIIERYRNEEPSKIRIVLGDMLLPTYVCQMQRNDRRLVPIGDLPPLYGSPNSHAAQAQLQLLIFSEFSNQSIRLAQEGSVVITMDKWKQLAYEAGLNPEKIDLVIDHWCEPDLFNCFLEKQGDEFRLATYYDREQKFLESQGNGRIVNSKRGKRSIENRRKKS